MKTSISRIPAVRHNPKMLGSWFDLNSISETSPAIIDWPMNGNTPIHPPSPAGNGLNRLHRICCATPAMINRLMPLPSPHPFWISSSRNMIMIDAAINCPIMIYKTEGSVISGPYTAIPYTTDSATIMMYVTSLVAV